MVSVCGIRATNLRFPDYLQGKVKIDEYVTHSRTLADINEGFDDMHVSAHVCL